jgi:hypothetical protein
METKAQAVAAVAEAVVVAAVPTADSTARPTLPRQIGRWPNSDVQPAAIPTCNSDAMPTVSTSSPRVLPPEARPTRTTPIALLATFWPGTRGILVPKIPAAQIDRFIGPAACHAEAHAAAGPIFVWARPRMHRAGSAGHAAQFSPARACSFSVFRYFYLSCGCPCANVWAK